MTEQTPRTGSTRGDVRGESLPTAGPPIIDDRPVVGRHVDDRPALAGPLVWVALMGLLLGGFVLMGASFTTGNGVLFGAGLLVSGLAFVVPLATGHNER